MLDATTKAALAQVLIATGAVKTWKGNGGNWFKLAKGGESPYYADCKGPLYSTIRLPNGIAPWPFVIEVYGKLLEDVPLDQVFGPAMAGVPLVGGFLMLRPGIRGGFYREAPKDHGTGTQIEGVITPDEVAAILEDVATSGKSALVTIRGLREAGLIVNDCAVLLNREQGGEAALAAEGVRLRAALTTTELFRAVVEQRLWTPEEIDVIGSYLREQGLSV